MGDKNSGMIPSCDKLSASEGRVGDKRGGIPSVVGRDCSTVSTLDGLGGFRSRFAAGEDEESTSSSADLSFLQHLNYVKQREGTAFTAYETHLPQAEMTQLDRPQLRS